VELELGEVGSNVGGKGDSEKELGNDGKRSKGEAAFNGERKIVRRGVAGEAKVVKGEVEKVVLRGKPFDTASFRNVNIIGSVIVNVSIDSLVHHEGCYPI